VVRYAAGPTMDAGWLLGTCIAARSPWLVLGTVIQYTPAIVLPSEVVSQNICALLLREFLPAVIEWQCGRWRADALSGVQDPCCLEMDIRRLPCCGML
jgi:hypothetical protein